MAYCSLENENSRVLEVPLWMLDVAACSKTQVSKLGAAETRVLRSRLPSAFPSELISITGTSEYSHPLYSPPAAKAPGSNPG